MLEFIRDPTRTADGVHVFTASSYAESFGRQWHQYGLVQLDSANGTSISEERFHEVTGWVPDDLRGRTVLDAGCGAGRFTEIAIKWGADVYAVDLSNAVFAARANVKGAGGAIFVQADCLDLPFAPRSFDFAFSIGVAQHTPDPLGFVRSVAKMLRPGGKAAFWIYERRLSAYLHAKYALRPITRRLSPGANQRLAKFLVSALFPIAERARRLPRPARRVLYRSLPIAIHLDQLELSVDAQRAWSELDTLDWYSPTHDNPQTYADVEATLASAGATRVDRRAAPGVTVLATF